MSNWEESEPSLVCRPSEPDPEFMKGEYSGEEVVDVVVFDTEFDEAARPESPLILHGFIFTDQREREEVS